MKATVFVRLKREVLDPQGDAIKRALSVLGFEGVRDVRVGKLVEIEFDDEAPKSPDQIKTELAKMADELLANPVIEDARIELSPAAQK
ncbi:MAG: phosphoribosylformylglycinamidine synthase subunit PurS [Polyangiaceae bacterium]|nr:phosphoribosylformylglycinamidine synthase subunit PurS [Polyangiaceae bacterium]